MSYKIMSVGCSLDKMWCVIHITRI